MNFLAILPSVKYNFKNLGEVTELVPVPDFKSAVTVRKYGEVSSILMLSRQIYL